jgi:hypothetical protein
MKVYFCAAVSQKQRYGETYKKIVTALEKLGHSVQHDHITGDGKNLETIKDDTDEQVVAYYKQALRWISRAELVVVEASFPSTLNVGHEITLALEKGKVVIVLYEKGHGSLFMHGMNSDKLIMVEYNHDNLAQLLEDSIEFAKESADTRFNFFISPRHINYLDWIAKTRKVPRSVYLRELIERDKAQNEEYELG